MQTFDWHPIYWHLVEILAISNICGIICLCDWNFEIFCVISLKKNCDIIFVYFFVLLFYLWVWNICRLCVTAVLNGAPYKICNINLLAYFSILVPNRNFMSKLFMQLNKLWLSGWAVWLKHFTCLQVTNLPSILYLNCLILLILPTCKLLNFLLYCIWFVYFDQFYPFAI